MSRREPVLITGMSVATAFGRGVQSLWDGLSRGVPAIGELTRFDTTGRRSHAGAQLPGEPDLLDELTVVVREACEQARLAETDRGRTSLLFARHADPAVARLPRAVQVSEGVSVSGLRLAARGGLAGLDRTYTNACVAASTAVADAAAAISLGHAERLLVAAGYLVDADNFALFDAGRALATDGHVRPFSAGRRGLLLGDGVAAVVLESASSARRRGAPELGRLAGWGRAGDAFHVCQPHPEGAGMARAIRAAIGRAGWAVPDIGYINAHGTGTPYNDSSEAAALFAALGDAVPGIPVSSTKSLHGHTLEASGLVELVVTVSALTAGRLPVNAGHLGTDPECLLNLVLDSAAAPANGRAMSLNAAFGGANTALLVEVS